MPSPQKFQYSLSVPNFIICCLVAPYDVIFEEAEEICSTLNVYYLNFANHFNVRHYAVYAVEMVSLNKPRIEDFCILEYNTV